MRGRDGRERWSQERAGASIAIRDAGLHVEDARPVQPAALPRAAASGRAGRHRPDGVEVAEEKNLPAVASEAGAEVIAALTTAVCGQPTRQVP